MDFRTEIDLPVGEFLINQRQKLMLMGSCFAEEVGKRLSRDKFDCLINPFGVLYNPHSIAAALSCLGSDKIFTEEDLFSYGGQWHSWMHHSSFSGESMEQTLEGINKQLQVAKRRLLEMNALILTLGNNRCYRLKENGQIVGNCHKVPERNFDVVSLQPSEIVDLLSPRIDELIGQNEEIRIIFTVSPIRYLKYGLHGSALGKSALLLAIDALQNKYPEHVLYFPAYEILLDDLRDYRFYAEDMVHPSEMAVDYIYDCFHKSFCDKESIQVAKAWREIEKALNHKPFNPYSKEYKCFLERTKVKIEQFQQSYPFVSVQKELEICTTRLSKLERY